MNHRFAKSLYLLLALGFASALHAQTLAVKINPPAPAETGYFKLGTTRNPAGHEWSVDSRSLLLDGWRVVPVMGEFHYSRCPENEWRDELLKMKAGGITIVSTYVFWIHHEEIQGQFDWSGRRDLKKFLSVANEVGLQVVVRLGPWCHGEVRNGGLPDWVQAHKGQWKLRSTDTNFLAAVKILYGQIASQLQGQLWKDGGPVIGVQVDNEFYGSPDYLMALKKMAIAAGIDVPFYIKTGWPAMKTPVPLGELLPLFGAYADGFWERTLAPMPGNGWENYTFKFVRTDEGIGNDTLKKSKDGDTAGTDKYPFLTCEVGGGMETSYHRRVKVFPRDVESVMLCQLGSGSVLPGYYMYHGGVNPDGKLSTLQESQATGYPNDLPVKSYDFQAPINEAGELNPQYHSLRRLHLFLHDFGARFAGMPSFLPDVRVTNRNDHTTLRWAVRSDGRSGFVFFNNYQRLEPMPAKTNVQFKINLPGGEVVFPSQPVTISADSCGFWPFNFDLGHGVNLAWATAQPVCFVDDGDLRTVFFAATEGVAPEFAFDSATKVEARSGKLATADGKVFVRDSQPGRSPAIEIKSTNSATVQIVLLDEADSLALWKGEFAGRERVVLAKGGVIFDDGKLRQLITMSTNLSISVLPATKGLTGTPGKPDGVFSLAMPTSAQDGGVPVLSWQAEPVKPAGALREIPRSTGKSQIALAPTDEDFQQAAEWHIKLNLTAGRLLRINFTGDVARLTLNGKLLTDRFYNGNALELKLSRYAPEILTGDLRLQILPLQKDAPIYLLKDAWPEFDGTNGIARVDQVEVLSRSEVTFEAKP